MFGKGAKDLSLSEAALLAGLPQLPNIYDPLNPDPDVQTMVRDRQGTVLDLRSEGPDADQQMRAVVALVEAGFGED